MNFSKKGGGGVGSWIQKQILVPTFYDSIFIILERIELGNNETIQRYVLISYAHYLLFILKGSRIKK